MTLSDPIQSAAHRLTVDGFSSLLELRRLTFRECVSLLLGRALYVELTIDTRTDEPAYARAAIERRGLVR